MKKSTLVTVITVFIIVILSVVQTVLSNRLSTAGVLISRIESEAHTYKLENVVLSEKLFLNSSLNSIAAKAAKLGFVENKSHFVLKSSLPLAVRQ